MCFRSAQLRKSPLRSGKLEESHREVPAMGQPHLGSADCWSAAAALAELLALGLRELLSGLPWWRPEPPESVSCVLRCCSGG